MILKEVTDEWVELFSDPDERTGICWRLALDGFLPDGVDPDDERVRAILGPDWRVNPLA